MRLVPHDVVEPKTRTKKKLVMQLDRDVQVWNIFVVFLCTPWLRFSTYFLRTGASEDRWMVAPTCDE
jgi:hypothetical protein